MVKQTYQNTSVTKRIRVFLKLLKRKGIRVSAIIIFGSYGKGTARKDSDIDVAVISDQFGKDAFREMTLLRKIALKVDSHIEPVPLNTEDLHDPFSTLIQEINRHGKRLVI